jgi:hypothetical protein
MSRVAAFSFLALCSTGCATPAPPEAAAPTTPASDSTVAGEGARASCAATDTPAPFAWTADGAAALGDAAPERLGEPRLEPGPHGNALCFDGVDDGLVFDRNPIAGLKEFTIQVLFRPDAIGTLDAPSEQRFVHFEEGSTTTPESRRALIETRVVGEQWYLDTFLRASNGSKALIDADEKHPVGRWYWVALTYADGTMRHYIDGKLELEGAVPFEPLCPGRASLGVRLNRVSWFKGCLRELRVTPGVVPSAELAALQ